MLQMGMKNNFIGILIITLLALSGCQKDEASKMFDNAVTLWEQKKYEEANQNFIALTKAFPDHGLVDDSLFWIANIYELYLNSPEESIRYYRSLTKRFENSDYFYQSMARLAGIYKTKDDEGLRKALLIYRKLLKRAPSEKEWEKMKVNLANVYFKLKYYEQSRSAFKKLINKTKDEELIARAYYSIGYSYYIEGKMELAKISFQETEKRYNYSKRSLSSAIHLADIYEDEGDLQSAVDVYESILKRLDQNEVLYQMAKGRISKLKNRLIKTHTGLNH